MRFYNIGSEQLRDLFGLEWTEILELVFVRGSQHSLYQHRLRINTQTCFEVSKSTTLHHSALVVERLLLSLRCDSDFFA